MAVVAFVSLDAGSGKTMLAAHLAENAHLQGAGPAAVIDTDVDGSLGRWWYSRYEDNPVHALNPEYALTFASRFAEDLVRLEKVGVRFCAVDIARAEPKLAGRYVAQTDLAVIPVGQGRDNMRLVRRTLDLIAPLCERTLLVFNVADAEWQEKERRRMAVLVPGAIESGRLAPVTVHQDRAFAKAMNRGRTVMETDPQGQAAKEIGELWEYLAERLCLPVP